MSTHLNPPAAAARKPAQGRQAFAGRRPQSSPADALERLSDRLDQLIMGLRLGSPSHRQLERHIDEAEAIADGIRGAFRKPTASIFLPRLPRCDW